MKKLLLLFAVVTTTCLTASGSNFDTLIVLKKEHFNPKDGTIYLKFALLASQNCFSKDLKLLDEKKLLSIFNEMGKISYQIGLDSCNKFIEEMKTKHQKEIDTLNSRITHKNEAVTTLNTSLEYDKAHWEAEKKTLEEKLKNLKVNKNDFFDVLRNSSKIRQGGLTLLSLYFLISGTCFTYFSLAPLIAKALGK